MARDEPSQGEMTDQTNNRLNFIISGQSQAATEQRTPGLVSCGQRYIDHCIEIVMRVTIIIGSNYYSVL